ncbi:MAG: efflux RND transporter periplasmic adaptor subunit [Proteobacteria bacterium]|nr:efflux RND transporter periplasmic adaptor subunit [Pseudomonadota bacterium]
MITLMFSGLAGLLSACNRDGAAAQTKTPTVDAVPVEVALAAHSAISASYSGTAALVADHEAQVTAKTSGVLKKLYVEEGMTVKAGQLLAELDDADALAKAKQAEAQMHKAEATFAHAQAAIPKHLIPEYEYEQDKFDLAAQRAAYEAANIQLSYTRIVAPVDGVIAERSIKLGNLVQANQNLFRIVGMNPLQAVLNVPERQLGILKAGQVVQLEADALPGKKFGGIILRIAPVVDPASGTFRVTCQFHDASAVLRPGMFARIDIVYDQRPDALTVPRAALVEEDGQTSVFVVDKAPPVAAPKAAAGKPAAKVPLGAPGGFVAHRQLVKIGYSDGDKVEILSGLEAGARVITVGRNAVRDGTAVLVLDNKA